jgi:hypothetical protein
VLFFSFGDGGPHLVEVLLIGFGHLAVVVCKSADYVNGFFACFQQLLMALAGPDDKIGVGLLLFGSTSSDVTISKR